MRYNGAVMGRKSSSKEQRPPSAAASSKVSPRGSGPSFIAIGIAILVLIGAGIYALKGGRDTAGTSATGAVATSASTSQAADKTDTAPDASEIAKNEAFAQAMTALGPHKQASYPPVPYQSFAPPRPYQTVNAAFQFAADHPEVLSYIPCFCGCQQGGHRGNEDCFVRSRDKNGDVTEWRAARRRVRRVHRRRHARAPDVHVGRVGRPDPHGDRKGIQGELSLKTPTPQPPAH